MQSSGILLEVENSMKVYCDKYEVQSLLTQEEYDYAGKLEAVLQNASKLTTIFRMKQNLIIITD